MVTRKNKKARLALQGHTLAQAGHELPKDAPESFGNFQPEHAETLSCLTFDTKTPPEPGSVPSVQHR